MGKPQIFPHLCDRFVSLGRSLASTTALNFPGFPGSGEKSSTPLTPRSSKYWAIISRISNQGEQRALLKYPIAQK